MYLNDRIEKKRNKRNMKLGGLKFAARLPWKQISQMMKLLQCTCARIMVPLQVYLVVVNPLSRHCDIHCPFYVLIWLYYDYYASLN